MNIQEGWQGRPVGSCLKTLPNCFGGINAGRFICSSIIFGCGMPFVEQIYSLIVLSLAVASVSWTVTQEEIFKEFHLFCDRRARRGSTFIGRKFFYLFTCEYCFSHWVTLFVLIVSGFRLLFDDWRGWILAFFVLPWIANHSMSLYRRLRVRIKYENALAENESDGADAG